MSRSNNKPTSPNGSRAGNVTLTLRRSVGLPRMAAQPRRRLVDATDIRPNPLGVPAPGQDEVAIVGLGALQVVHHQVSPVCLLGPFEPLHGREHTPPTLGRLG